MKTFFIESCAAVFAVCLLAPNSDAKNLMHSAANTEPIETLIRFRAPAAESDLSNLVLPETENRARLVVRTVRFSGVSYPGKDKALLRDIQTYLSKNFPNLSSEEAELKIRAMFMVRKDGSVSDIQILSDQELDKQTEYAVENAIRSLKNFNPASVNQQPIDFKIVVPILFKVI